VCVCVRKQKVAKRFSWWGLWVWGVGSVGVGKGGVVWWVLVCVCGEEGK